MAAWAVTLPGMARYLLCATPAGGHVRPVLSVASGLVARGHEVTVLTGSRFRAVVEAAGIAFRALTGPADIDDRNPDSFLPDRHRYKGFRLAQYQLRRIFVDPVPAQYHDVTEALRATGADAVVVDAMFLGALPILERPTRVPVVALGVSPLSLPSPDVPPYNSGLIPMRGAVGRARNTILHGVGKRAFRELDRYADRVLRDITDRGLPGGLFGVVERYDRYLQLGPAEFEYPRRDLPPNVRFVGSLGTEDPGRPPELPSSWWPELEGRRVAHVTQGTAANFDLTTLIGRPSKRSATRISPSSSEPAACRFGIWDRCRRMFLLPSSSHTPNCFVIPMCSSPTADTALSQRHLPTVCRSSSLPRGRTNVRSPRTCASSAWEWICAESNRHPHESVLRSAGSWRTRGTATPRDRWPRPVAGTGPST